MTKRLAIPALWALLVIVPALAEAQAPQPAPDTASATAAGNSSPAKPAASATPRAKLRPFTKEMVSKEDYADAIRNCDKTVLNADCDDWVVRLNAIHKLGLDVGEERKAREQAADYVMSLNEVQCAQSREATLDAVTPDGKIVPGGIRRVMQKGERCLVDTNSGAWVLSLMCGNLINSGLGGIFPTDTEKRDSELDGIRRSLEAIQEKLKEGSAPPPPAPVVGGAGEADPRNMSRYTERQEESRSVAEDPRSFWQRHKKPILIGAGTAAVVGGLLGYFKPFKNTNIQNNYGPR